MDASAKSRNTSCPSRIFKDFRIFILPTLISKKRLAFFESLITKGGGTLCSVNQLKSGEVQPTHSVVEDSLLQDPKALTKQFTAPIDFGIVVGTRWLSDSIKFHTCMATKNYGPIQNFTEKNPSFSQAEASLAPKKQKLDDAVVKKDEDSHACCSKETIAVDKFACSQSSSSSNQSLRENLLIIQELQKLADAFRHKGDTWRAHGYTKAISAIKRCGKALCSYEDAVSLPGVGEKIASKVWEILETGSLRKVSEVCEDEKTRSLEIFVNIWGVGPATAAAWYLQGCRSLNDVKEKMSLSKQQEIGLKHYEDFQIRIPRCEVEEVGQIVSTSAKSIESQLTVTLVGSYRRGKESCGDIDVMICKPDHLNSKDILSQLLRCLKDSDLVTDDLVSMEKKGNQRKYLGVCRLPGHNRVYRRLDIFVVPKSEAATALMHYTGSALFNRSIRLLAAKKGMSLSEHSLHGGIVREGLKVLNEGHLIPTPTEESIFKALGLDYRQPEERDH